MNLTDILYSTAKTIETIFKRHLVHGITSLKKTYRHFCNR